MGRTRDAEVPSARPGSETHACTLEEIIAYLRVVPEPGATLIATAAFTGVLKSELRALRWEHYNGQEMKITQKAWGRHIGPPKRDSRGDVPVIPLLAQYLDRQRLAAGDPVSGHMFANTLGTPMSLDRVTSYVIRPALKKADLQWHGWHAFRRGRATNLHRLGVQDKIIQRILRHANLATTMNIYVKSVSEDAVAAMLRLQARCSRLLPVRPLSERIM